VHVNDRRYHSFVFLVEGDQSRVRIRANSTYHVRHSGSCPLHWLAADRVEHERNGIATCCHYRGSPLRRPADTRRRLRIPAPASRLALPRPRPSPKRRLVGSAIFRTPVRTLSMHRGVTSQSDSCSLPHRSHCDRAHGALALLPRSALLRLRVGCDFRPGSRARGGKDRSGPPLRAVREVCPRTGGKHRAAVRAHRTTAKFTPCAGANHANPLRLRHEIHGLPPVPPPEGRRRSRSTLKPCSTWAQEPWFSCRKKRASE
jgi:hypothetical protein